MGYFPASAVERATANSWPLERVTANSWPLERATGHITAIGPIVPILRYTAPSTYYPLYEACTGPCCRTQPSTVYYMLPAVLDSARTGPGPEPCGFTGLNP